MIVLVCWPGFTGGSCKLILTIEELKLKETCFHSSCCEYTSCSHTAFSLLQSKISFLHCYFTWMFDLRCAEWWMCRIWHQKAVYTLICRRHEWWYGSQSWSNMQLRIRKSCLTYIEEKMTAHWAPVISLSMHNRTRSFSRQAQCKCQIYIPHLVAIHNQWHHQNTRVHLSSSQSPINCAFCYTKRQ